MKFWPERTFTEADLRERLISEVLRFGSCRAWATANGINYSYAFKAWKGQQGIGPLIATALGYRKVHRYVKEGNDVSPAE